MYSDLTQEQKEEVVRLYTTGILGHGALGRKLGYTSGAVSWCLNKAGVSRTFEESHKLKIVRNRDKGIE